jgi:high-affinity iron transporter
VHPRTFISFLILFSLCLQLVGTVAYAESKQSTEHLLELADQVLEASENNHSPQESKAFKKLKNEWFQVKPMIRKDSYLVSIQLESSIASATHDRLNDDGKSFIESMKTFKKTLSNYESGTLSSKPKKSKEKMSITHYLSLLSETRDSITSKDEKEIAQKISSIQSNWLNVEGDVVSQSHKVYTDSEKNLVLIKAHAEEKDYEKSAGLINQMIYDLEPLANHSYGIWDAAFIPLREGLEALLVIGALLTVSKKTNSSKGTKWVWGGTGAGVLISIIVGFLVTYVLSNISFGKSNFILNGLSGVLASLMLLYVSYWLHRYSNIQKWNTFVHSQTENALKTGSLFSFGLIAFLAVLREGLESVIFLIGFQDRMTLLNLILGLVMGMIILFIVGFIMLKIGSKIPYKPFFLISSTIVLYLCVKFMGSGIHSLQLAGEIPSKMSLLLPSIDLIGVFPSWYSVLPQLLIICLVFFFFMKKKRMKQTRSE